MAVHGFRIARALAIAQHKYLSVRDFANAAQIYFGAPDSGCGVNGVDPQHLSIRAQSGAQIRLAQTREQGYWSVQYVSANDPAARWYSACE